MKLQAAVAKPVPRATAPLIQPVPQATGQPAAQQVTPPITQPKSVPVTPQQDIPATASTSVATPATSPISVTLHVVERSWVQITSDGKVLLAGELAPESQKSFTASKEMVVKLGNASGVEISYNGKPLSPFGPEDKTKTLTFTPDGQR